MVTPQTEAVDFYTTATVQTISVSDVEQLLPILNIRTVLLQLLHSLRLGLDQEQKSV
jgi:hypothetical protein